MRKRFLLLIPALFIASIMFGQTQEPVKMQRATPPTREQRAEIQAELQEIRAEHRKMKVEQRELRRQDCPHKDGRYSRQQVRPGIGKNAITPKPQITQRGRNRR